MLSVQGLCAGYGGSGVLQGVSFEVRRGEIVSLLGRNGAGRSTVVKALIGLVPAQGSVSWRGEPILGEPPHRIARRGIGYVPESRDVFARLSVEQNLLLGVQHGLRSGAGRAGSTGRDRPARWSLDDMYRLFPPLAQRRTTPAGVLSGGEQQMLTLCRTLMGDPDLVLIDEPTEGLAPRVVAQVAEFLHELRRAGVGVLLVEQKLGIALQLSDRCLVIGHGRIVFDGTPQALHDDLALRREWLEI